MLETSTPEGFKWDETPLRIEDCCSVEEDNRLREIAGRVKEINIMPETPTETRLREIEEKLKGNIWFML